MRRIVFRPPGFFHKDSGADYKRPGSVVSAARARPTGPGPEADALPDIVPAKAANQITSGARRRLRAASMVRDIVILHCHFERAYYLTWNYLES